MIEVSASLALTYRMYVLLAYSILFPVITTAAADVSHALPSYILGLFLRHLSDGRGGGGSSTAWQIETETTTNTKGTDSLDAAAKARHMRGVRLTPRCREIVDVVLLL